MTGKYTWLVIRYLLIFSITAIALSILIYQLSGDREAFYLENETCVLRTKTEAFLQVHQQQPVNILFFGSSKTFRQINPEIFDQQISGAHSYNLGVNALFPVRSFDMVRHILTYYSNTEPLQVAFIELSPITKLGPNWNKAPSMNAIDFERYTTILEQSAMISDPAEQQRYIKNYTRMMGYKYYGFGIARRIRQIFGIYEQDDSSQCIDADYVANRGYYPRDQQLVLDPEGSKSLIRDQKSFQRQFVRGKKSLPGSFQYQLQENQLPANPEMPFNRFLQEMIDAIQPRVNKIVFLLPPRSNVADIVYLKEAEKYLNENGYPVMDFSDPEKFPEFYQPETSFDRFHLNREGADLYTRKIAEAYLATQ